MCLYSVSVNMIYTQTQSIKPNRSELSEGLVGLEVSFPKKETKALSKPVNIFNACWQQKENFFTYKTSLYLLLSGMRCGESFPNCKNHCSSQIPVWHTCFFRFSIIDWCHWYSQLQAFFHVCFRFHMFCQISWGKVERLLGLDRIHTNVFVVLDNFLFSLT